MSESAIVENWADARKTILANAPWCLLLVAIERAFEGHFSQAVISFLLCLLALGIAIHWKAFEGLGRREGRRRLALILITIGAACVAVGIFLAFGPKAKEPVPPTFAGSMIPARDVPRNQLNLKAALQDEFSPGTFRTAADIPYKDKDGKAVEIQVSEFNDPHNGAQFLAAYISATSSTTAIAKEIISAHNQLLKQLEPAKGSITISAKGEHGSLATDNVRFTGKIFIYHDQLLSTEEYAQIDETAQAAGVSVTMRDPRYLTR